MSLPPASGCTLRLDLPVGAIGPSRGLPAGRPLTVTVVESLGEGRWVVNVGGQRTTAFTSLEMAVGDRLEVVAHAGNGALELRLVGMAARVDQARYDAAAVEQAGGTLQPVPLNPPAGRLLALLRTLLMDRLGSTASGQVEALAQAIAGRLEPVDPRQGPDRVSAQLRSMVLEGGLLLESRLLQALQGQARQEQVPPGAATSDLRGLLSALERTLSAATDADPVGLSTAIRAEVTSLSADTLSRQLDLALQWLRTGELHVQVPITLHDQVRIAHLRLSRRRTSPRLAGRRGSPVQAVDLHLDLAALGQVLARVRWSGTHVAASVYVERTEVAELARVQVPALSLGLKGAGFRTVDARVVVDPRAVRGGEAPATDMDARGGAIFRARA